MICKNKKCGKEIPEGSAYCLYCGVSQAAKERKPKSRGNGTGTVYQRGKKYVAEVTLYYYIGDDGNLHRKKATKTFERKKDAVDYLPTLAGTSDKAGITFEQLHNEFLESRKYQKLSKSQKDKLGYAWKRLAALHRKPISETGVDDMQTVINRMTNTYYPARDMRDMLSHLYKLAMKKEICTYNKTENLELPELKKKQREAFDDLEVQRFWKDFNELNDIGQRLHPFTGYILILLYTGMRPGELFDILLKNIYLDERYMIGGNKTEAGTNRRIPIATKIVPIIRELMHSRRRKLLEMNEDNFYAAYWETVERVGVRHLVPYTCRHTYFTRLASKSTIAPAVIAEAGGHADFETTYENYIHTPLEELLKAVDQL